MRASIILGGDHQLSKVIALTQGALQCIPYTPYGFSRPQGGAMVIGFTGQYFDGCLEGYLLGNGYRVYSPWLMRFKSPDRVSPFGRGGINGYAYCEGDPVNWQDRSGYQKGRTVSMHHLNKSGDLSDYFVSALRTVVSYAIPEQNKLARRKSVVEGRVGDSEYFLDQAKKNKQVYTPEYRELLMQLSQLVVHDDRIGRKKARFEKVVNNLNDLIGKNEVARFEEPLNDSGMIPIGTGDQDDEASSFIIDERPRLGTWPSADMSRLRQGFPNGYVD
ncbi:hypothetical protein PRtIB026_A02720 [Pseudomonas sp. RtIB026]|uniref:RHS repeat-associated core domain-containing protein n=1 Tax=Pseudomonas sp. RtIB026 TaxID=2749999 RepID=UPI0022714BEF|nr:RHS repeat-associated core domain-containing protein [Pseudomonas sp. RtIB026]BDU09554.1 hypothetical protein PRtIB026_A02720 [Pseudomonas sp. RtIB026]